MYLWNGDKDVVYSLSTTEQTGRFELSNRVEKAFKWHLFDSAALSGFKSVPSPAHIDI